MDDDYVNQAWWSIHWNTTMHAPPLDSDTVGSSSSDAAMLGVGLAVVFTSLFALFGLQRYLGPERLIARRCVPENRSCMRFLELLGDDSEVLSDVAQPDQHDHGHGEHQQSPLTWDDCECFRTRR